MQTTMSSCPLHVLRCSAARVHMDLEILECLGEGGFGAVHRARLRSSGEIVACKIVHVMSNQDVDQEVRILSKLHEQQQQQVAKDDGRQTTFVPGRQEKEEHNYNNDDHIVRLKGAYFDGDRFYLVMDFCQGGTLLEALSSRKGMRMTEVEAAMVLQGVTRGLLHCKAKRIVHRDVKPANIMLRRKGDLRSVILVDFGLATEVHDPHAPHTGNVHIFPASSRAVAGTSQYIAPEVQIAGAAHRYNCQADIYSLGVVLHNMLTGMYPSTSYVSSYAHATSCDGSVPISMVLQKYWGGVSMGARLLVRDMLHRDPDCRPSLEGILHHFWLLRSAAQYEYRTTVLDHGMAPSTTPDQVKPSMQKVINQAPNQQPKIKAIDHDQLKHQQQRLHVQKKLNDDMQSTPPQPDWQVLLPQTVSSSSFPSGTNSKQNQSFDLAHALRKQCRV